MLVRYHDSWNIDRHEYPIIKMRSKRARSIFAVRLQTYPFVHLVDTKTGNLNICSLVQVGITVRSKHPRVVK